MSDWVCTFAAAVAIVDLTACAVVWLFGISGTRSASNVVCLCVFQPWRTRSVVIHVHSGGRVVGHGADPASGWATRCETRACVLLLMCFFVVGVE